MGLAYVLCGKMNSQQTKLRLGIACRFSTLPVLFLHLRFKNNVNFKSTYCIQVLVRKHFIPTLIHPVFIRMCLSRSHRAVILHTPREPQAPRRESSVRKCGNRRQSENPRQLPAEVVCKRGSGVKSCPLAHSIHWSARKPIQRHQSQVQKLAVGEVALV